MTQPRQSARTAPAPKRKRRRGLGCGIVVLVLVLLVAGAVVLDNVARGMVADQVAGKVRSALSVPAKTPVKVTVAGTSVLLQLVTGSLDRVDVGMKQVALGELSGSAKLTASGIPIDRSKPTEHARIEFTTDQTAVTKLFSDLPGLKAQSVKIAGGKVTVGTTVTLFGFALPVGITFTPTAKGGSLQLAPTSISVNNQDFTAEQLAKSSFGALANSLFVTQTVCVAALLPKGFTLQSIDFSGKTVSLAVTANNVVLDAKAMASRGTCPAQ